MHKIFQIDSSTLVITQLFVSSAYILALNRADPDIPLKGRVEGGVERGVIFDDMLYTIISGRMEMGEGNIS